jgi:hypothetical protein
MPTADCIGEVSSSVPQVRGTVRDLQGPETSLADLENRAQHSRSSIYAGVEMPLIFIRHPLTGQWVTFGNPFIGGTMPRHNRRAPKAAKPPKPPKMIRPKVKDLRMVLKGLLTVSIGDRLAALHYALQWYDGVVPYMFGKKMIPMGTAIAPTKEQKRIALAIKARKQAQGTKIDHEKETALLLAVKSYEIACAMMKPASVEKYYELYKLKKETLEKKQAKLELKFGLVFQLMQKVVGQRFKITVSDAQKARQYNPNLSTLNYNREAAKAFALQFRAEGFLPVFIGQLETFSRSASLYSDGKGGFVYDTAKHLEAYNEMLAELVAFLKTGDAPRKLIRNGVVPVPKPMGAAPAAAGTPARAPRVTSKGPKVLGFLTPGTAIHKVYENLQDQQEHDMAQAIIGVLSGDPVGRVKQLQRYGVEKGTHTITINGSKVKLTLAAGVTP